MTVRTYPSLSVAALRHELDTWYQVWLAARWLDSDGRGWVRVDELRAALVPARYSWRRLRQILNGGHSSLFWTIESVPAGARLRYTGAAALAVGMGVERLTGDPVELPQAALTARIGEFRAYCHASYLAGHADDATGETGPLSRHRLRTITGRSPVTQRRYEAAAGVTAHRNIAIGEPLAQHPDREERNALRKAQVQEAHWNHTANGRPIFRFVDHLGVQGEKGRHYIAWCLPNSYSISETEITTAPQGRKKKINAVCNARCLRERAAGTFSRLFFFNRTLAERRFSRNPDNRLYVVGRAAGQVTGVWHSLEPVPSLAI